MGKPDITHSYLLSILDYDPDTGVFTNKIRRSSRTLPGAVVGSRQSGGYLTVCVAGKIYFLHRLAWFYHYGAWPLQDIDHIDRDRTNNAIHNLRLASKAEQSFNRGSPGNATGMRGVEPVNDGARFVARIRVRGSRVYLGCFATAEEAHAAYCKAAQELHGEFAFSP
jgi:hypothetical protein